ncbi:MAG: class I SAM-dependent methyltransferase [Pseudomonadota bacterium]
MLPPPPSPTPTGLFVEPGGETRAAHLLALFKLTPGGDQPGIQLVVKADGLWLRDSRDPKRKPFQPSFSLPALRVTRREPLARALGRTVRSVVDATAGLGGDALRLAGLGCTVIAVERSPWIAALLDDALARLRAGAGTLADLAGRITLIHADAREFLANHEDRPDAVYLDPMFPPKRRKRAAVRKELLWLRELAGDDPDADALLSAALAAARERVIVKRPDHAPPIGLKPQPVRPCTVALDSILESRRGPQTRDGLIADSPLGPKPTVSYPGKLVRYDVYRTDLFRQAPRE